MFIIKKLEIFDNLNEEQEKNLKESFGENFVYIYKIKESKKIKINGFDYTSEKIVQSMHIECEVCGNRETIVL